MCTTVVDHLSGLFFVKGRGLLGRAGYKLGFAPHCVRKVAAL